MGNVFQRNDLIVVPDDLLRRGESIVQHDQIVFRCDIDQLRQRPIVHEL